MIFRAATVALFALGASACAAIWGFQDSVDLPDSADAQSSGPAAPPESGAADGTLGDDGSPGVSLIPEAGFDEEGGSETSAAEASASEAGVAETSALEASVPEASAVEASATEAAAAESGVPEAMSPEASAAEAGPMDAAVDAPDAATQPICSTVCVPPPTSPWLGPYELFEATGSPAPMLPSCGAGSFALDVYDGVSAPSAPAATCACNCGSPLGATCSSPVISFFDDFSCTQPCSGVPPSPLSSSCNQLPGCNFLQLGGSIPQGGSCAPSASKKVASPAWTSRARLCAGATPPTGSGCGGGALCVPPGTVPFTGYCIARTGTGYACPSGYPVQKIYYASGTDTRDCTTCSCGGPTGVSCAGGAGVASRDSNCNRNTASLTAPMACNFNNYQSATFTPAAPAGGSCVPQGGRPTGTFTPTNPTTICCTP